MGTRADFYVRQDNQMKWLGSIAWDGYPEGIEESILKAETLDGFETSVIAFLSARKDASFPKDGWPWPWDDSRTTDYAYIFENGKVMASCFGYPLFDPLNPSSEDDESEDKEQKMDGYFPDMKDIKNINYGERSGVIIISVQNKI